MEVKDNVFVLENFLDVHEDIRKCKCSEQTLLIIL